MGSRLQRTESIASDTGWTSTRIHPPGDITPAAWLSLDQGSEEIIEHLGCGPQTSTKPNSGNGAQGHQELALQLTTKENLKKQSFSSPSKKTRDQKCPRV